MSSQAHPAAWLPDVLQAHPEERGSSVRASEYWKALRAHWVVVLFIVLLGGAAGLAVAALQPKTFSADASGMLTVQGTGDLSSALSGDSYAKSRVTSYLDVAASRSVAELAKEDLGLEESPDALLGRIVVTNPTDTVNIQVTATGSTPEESRDLAEAWVRALGVQINELEGARDGGRSVVEFVSLDSAQLPTSPSSPNTRLYILVGILVGAFLGVLYSLIRHTFDRRVRAIAQVEEATGVSVVGSVPSRKSGAEGRLITTVGGNDTAETDINEYAVAEALRQIRTNLQFMDVDNPPRQIVITSSIPGEGKSFIAANLAATLAATGEDVVLVDADLRRPMIAETFGLVGSVGLTDVLAGRAQITDVLQPVGDAGHLFVLAAGSIPPNPSEILGSRAMQALLKELSQHAVVLVDTPPLLPVTDAAILAAQADGAMIVTTAGRSTLDMLGESLAALRRVHGRALGIIINRVPLRGAATDGYGYSRRHYYRRSAAAAAESAEAGVGPAERAPTSGANVPAPVVVPSAPASSSRRPRAAKRASAPPAEAQTWVNHDVSSGHGS